MALKVWQRVRERMEFYQFINDEEEIQFFKTIKPKFTGYIEYLMLVNHGLLFIPTESNDAQQIYWQYEVERMGRFKDRNKAFVEYYESGSTQNDRKYFLPVNGELSHQFSRIYDLHGDFVTSHDHLVASLFAEKKYHEFAKKKLNESLKNYLKN